MRLESLEWRDQPSDIPLGTPPPGAVVYFGTDADAGVVPVNARPVIVDFEADQIANGLFLISGRVRDENPGGLTITFGGGTSASGQTDTTTTDGTFDWVVRLRADGTDSGFLTAKTTNGVGQESARVQVFLDPTPP